MKRQLRKALSLVGILVLTVVVFTGTALADPGEPTGEPQTGNGLARMVEWMGPENWGQMVQRMTQIHGPETTGQMLQRMNQSGGCHNADGTGSMMGHSDGRGMWNNNTDEQSGYGFQRSVMGRGMNW